MAAAMVWGGALCGSASAVSAQQLNATAGQATGVDLVATARAVSMRDIYARSLYLHVRANPTKLDDPTFYANFVIFLLNESPDFKCDKAFANEFEKRDFFTQAFAIKPQIAAAVNGVTIPQRFDIAFSIQTGNYDFTTATLPFADVATVGARNELSTRVSESNQTQYCARNILRGTEVSSQEFPWSFDVVTEGEEQHTYGGNGKFFPFGGSMNLSDSDARILFERFGRKLYAIVSYSVLAANDGHALLQIIPTDGQMFGLAADAVVRVKTHAHPTMSQVNYLDFSNPLHLAIPAIGLTADTRFEQDGFRAVGKGTSRTRGTGITAGQVLPVSGSAAVGNSSFVVRLATGPAYAPKYLTLFGDVDFEKVTGTSVPVSGVVEVIDPSDADRQALNHRNFTAFTGSFSPGGETRPEPAAPSSKLDQSSIIPTTDPAEAETAN